MRYEVRALTTLSLWLHVKTHGVYIVLGVAECSTGTRQEQSVVYWSCTHGGLRYREVNEFLDGRFKPLDDRGKEPETPVQQALAMACKEMARRLMPPLIKVEANPTDVDLAKVQEAMEGYQS